MKTRSQYAGKNLKYSVVYQITNLAIKFILRTIFIYTLGKEYLGVNGVFTNILTVLSLSELGLGTVIIYDMYKPIAENDRHKATQLFHFYKKVYTAIGIIILALGLCLIPFLKYIINDVPNVSNLYLIYVLQLLTTTSTYFFAQYRSYFDANQLNAANTKNNWIFNIIKTVIQAVVLLTIHNYIFYLITDLAVTVLSNYQISLKCKKQYPYLNDKCDPLQKEYSINTLKNAMSMFSIKVGVTVLNATDNLLISTLISTTVVGIYSNYSMITSVITASTMMISSSLQASVGNLCAVSNKENIRIVFKRIYFLYASIYAIVCSCLFSSLNSFIQTWAGESYVLNTSILFIIVFNLYLTGVHEAIEIFIYADGLFKHFKIKPWIEVVINLGVSIVLGEKIGLLGIFIGTAVSHLTTTLWFDSKIIYENTLKENYVEYWKMYTKYAGLGFLISIVLYNVMNLMFTDTTGWTSTILKVIISFILSSLIWLILFSRSDEEKYYKNYINKLIHEN